jgi:hypothetical protein
MWMNYFLVRLECNRKIALFYPRFNVSNVKSLISDADRFILLYNDCMTEQMSDVEIMGEHK